MKHSHLGTKPIPRLLLENSLPAIFAMFINALYNLVDTYFVGRWVGEDAIGGLTISFPIQLLILSLGLMLGVGAASGISRNLGAGEQERARSFLRNAVFLGAVLSAILTFAGLVFTQPMLKLFGATPNLMGYAEDYVKIVLWGTFPSIFVLSTNHMLRGEGQAYFGMISMLIGAISNILLDPVFIYVLKMGVQGAAIATLISQIFSMIFQNSYFYSKRNLLGARPHELALDKEIASEIVQVGFPTMIRNALASIMAILLNRYLGFYGGDVAISAYGVVNRVNSFVMLPSFGIIQGLQPIVGYNYGAKKYPRVRHAIQLALGAMVSVLLLLSLSMMLFSKEMMLLFGDSREFLELGSTMMKYIFIMLPLVSLQILSSSLFQSLGQPRPAMVIALLRQAVLFIPLLIILPKIGLGLTGILLAFPISDFLSSLYGGLRLHQVYQTLKDSSPLADE